MSPGLLQLVDDFLPHGDSGFSPETPPTPALQQREVEAHHGLETSNEESGFFAEQDYDSQRSYESPLTPTDVGYDFGIRHENLRSDGLSCEEYKIASLQMRASSSSQATEALHLLSNRKQRLPQNLAAPSQTMERENSRIFQLDEADMSRDLAGIENSLSPNLSANIDSSNSHTTSLEDFNTPIPSSNGDKVPSTKTCFLGQRDSLHAEAFMSVQQKLEDPQFEKYPNETKSSSLSMLLVNFYQKWARSTTEASRPTNNEVIDLVQGIICIPNNTRIQCRDIVNNVDLLYGGFGWVPIGNDDSGIVLSPPEMGDSTVPPSSKRPREVSSENSMNAARPLKLSRGEPPSTPQFSQGQSTSSSVKPKEHCPDCGQSMRGNNISKHRIERHRTKFLHFCPLVEKGQPCRKKFTREENLRKHLSTKLGSELYEDEAVDQELKKAIPPYRFEVPKEYHDAYHKTCPHCGPDYELEDCQKSIEHVIQHHIDGKTSLFPKRRANEAENSQELAEDHRQWFMYAELAVFATHWRNLPRLEIEDLRKLKDSHRGDKSSFSTNGSNDKDPGNEHSNGHDGYFPNGNPQRRGGGAGGGGTHGSGGGFNQPNSPPRTGGYGAYQNSAQKKPASETSKAKFYSRLSHNGRKSRSYYKSVRELGRGGFGVVDEVKCSQTDRTWARKSIPLRLRMSSNVLSEISILAALSHSHIIRLEDSYTNRSRVCLIMSPVAERDLATFLGDLSMRRETSQQDPSQLERKQMRKWVTCLTSAVDYLHDKGIVHGDIKPKNVLVDSSEIFLTDFGFSIDQNVPGETSISTRGMTPKYCPPEAESPSTLETGGSAADVFSLGCVYAEMATVYSGQTIQAFESFRARGTGDTAFRNSILRCHLWLDSLAVQFDSGIGCPYDFLDLVKGMLSFNPSSRPTVRDLLIRFQGFWPPESLSKDPKDDRNKSAGCSCQRAHLAEDSQSLENNLLRKDKFWRPVYQESVSCEHYEGGSNLWLAQLSTETYFGLLFEIPTPTVQKWDASSDTWILSPDKKNEIFSTFILITSHTNEDVFSLYKRLAYRQLEEAPIFLTPRLIETTNEPKYKSFQGFHTLKDYFQTTPPPTSARDIILLWISVLGLFESRKWHSRLWLMETAHVAVKHFWTKKEVVLVHEIEGKSPYEWNFGLSNLDTGSNCTLLSGQPMLTVKPRYYKKSLAPNSLSDIRFVGVVLAEVVKWLFQTPNRTLLNGKATGECYTTPPISPISSEPPKLDDKSIQSLMLKNERLGSDYVTTEMYKHVIMPLLVPPTPPFSHFSNLDDYSAMAWGVIQNSWQNHSTFTISLTMDPVPTFHVPNCSRKIRRSRLKQLELTEDESGMKPPDQDSLVSSHPCQPQIERYLREPADFRCLFVPEYDPLRRDSEELHRRLLTSLTRLDHVLS